MVSVASDGATDRIKARILFKVLRAGSGTRARYSSMSFGAALRFAVEPRALAFAFFIRGILQKRSFPVHASDSSVRAGHYVASIPAQRFMVLSSSRPESSLHRGCAQLHFVEFAACPGLRHGKHDECEGIPVGPESRSLVPGHSGAHNAHGKADEAAHQGVQHGPVGREPRDDVATHNAVDSAIGRCKQEGPLETGHRRAPWWEDMDRVQHDVCAKCENYAHDHARKHGSNASANTARRIRFAHDRLLLSPFGRNPLDRTRLSRALG